MIHATPDAQRFADRRILHTASGTAVGFGIAGTCGMMLCMIALKAHFDGKVIVPDEPLGLAPNAKLRITVEQVDPAPSHTVDLSWLRGRALDPQTNPNPRFASNDDLHEDSR